MDILNAIDGRRARRAVSPDALERGQVERLLAAAVLAPSCYNNQPWRLVAVTSPDALASLRATLSEGNAWALSAPLLVVFATKPSLDCRMDEGRDYAFFDLGAAAMNLQLEAVSEGLVAHPIAGFAPKKARKALGIPEDYVVLAIVVVGKPGDPALLDERLRAAEAAPRDRKPLTEVVCFDRWTAPPV